MKRNRSKFVVTKIMGGYENVKKPQNPGLDEHAGCSFLLDASREKKNNMSNIFRNLPLVTLFTDAGFCPDKFVGSWAAWAKCNNITMRKAGILKNKISNPNEAEIQAILNGISCAIGFYDLPEGSKFIIQTDSTSAIVHLESNKNKFENYRNMFQNITSGFKIEFRHVKGHNLRQTGNERESRRSAVNDWCDSQCTKFLKEAREAVIL